MSRRKEDSNNGSFITRILVPIDGSQNATRALKKGIVLARTYGAQIVILNVIPAPNILIEAPAGFGVTPRSVSEYYSQQEISANRFVDEAVSMCKHQGISCSSEVVRASKSTVEEIIETASKRNADLVVIGTRGLGGFRKLLQGSVSTGVVTHAGCDVMIVR